MGLIIPTLGVTATGEITYSAATPADTVITGVALREYIPQTQNPSIADELRIDGTVGSGTTTVMIGTDPDEFPANVDLSKPVSVRSDLHPEDEISFVVDAEAGTVVITHPVTMAGTTDDFEVGYFRKLANGAEAQAYLDTVDSSNGIKIRTTNVTANITDSGIDVILLKNGPAGGFVQSYSPMATSVGVNAVISALLT